MAFPAIQRWCKMGARVGIIHTWPLVVPEVDAEGVPTGRTVSDPSLAEVHFVDEKGETVEEAMGVPVAALTEATLADIPAARLPDVNHPELGAAHAELLAGLGYRASDDAPAAG